MLTSSSQGGGGGGGGKLLLSQCGKNSKELESNFHQEFLMTVTANCNVASLDAAIHPCIELPMPTCYPSLAYHREQSLDILCPL